MLSRWEWITNVLARGGGAPSGEPSWFRCWAETSGLFLLLYAGRLGKEKNLLLLPPTLERLRATGNLDFRFVIAGSGPPRGRVTGSVQRMCSASGAVSWAVRF